MAIYFSKLWGVIRRGGGGCEVLVLINLVHLFHLVHIA
jgi:hypothetical protein